MKFAGTVVVAKTQGSRGTRFNVQVSQGHASRFLEVEMTPDEFARAISGEVVSCVVDLRPERILPEGE